MTNEIQSFYTPGTSHVSHASSAIDGIINMYSSTMSSTASTPTVKRKSRPNTFQRLVDRVQLEYYRYEVTFGLYVMTPSEKCVANTFVLVVTALMLWALLLYFPSLLWNKLSRLVWLLTGHNGEDVDILLGVSEQYGKEISPISVAENVFPS